MKGGVREQRRTSRRLCSRDIASLYASRMVASTQPDCPGAGPVQPHPFAWVRRELGLRLGLGLGLEIRVRVRGT